MLTHIFYNSNEGRMRSFWRLLITAYFCGLPALVVAILIQLVVQGRLAAVVIGSIATLLIVATCVLLAGAFLDQRAVVDFGLRFSRRWLADLLFGLLLGVMLVSGIVLVEYLAGWLEEGQPSVEFRFEESRVVEITALVLLFIAVGVYEELLFRGYLLKNMAEGWCFTWLGRRGALAATVLATSLLFAVVHLSNPHSTLVASGNTALSGIMLSLGLLMTGELAIPIGFHITWNMSLCVLYGLPVSGLTMGQGLLTLKSTGPGWLTGGDYGPEGGLLCTLAMVVGMLLTVAWVWLGKQSLRIDTRLAEAPDTGWVPIGKKSEIRGTKSETNPNDSKTE